MSTGLNRSLTIDIEESFVGGSVGQGRCEVTEIESFIRKLDFIEEEESVGYHDPSIGYDLLSHPLMTGPPDSVPGHGGDRPPPTPTEQHRHLPTQCCDALRTIREVGGSWSGHGMWVWSR